MKLAMFGFAARFAWAGPSFLLIALAGCGAAATSAPAPAPASASAAAPASSAESSAASPAPAGQAHRAAGDVCSLVTEAEASAALGGSTGPGTPRGSGENQACEFMRSGAGFLQVGFNPNQTRGQFDAARAKVEGASDVPGSVVVEVPGLGDANFVSSSPHGGGCYVLKGSTLGHITLISPTELAAAADTMSTLCRAMGGRL